MDQQAEPKKRRGRPPMAKEDRKGGNLTFRVRDGMREWLEASAAARGVSISEEVEKRLEQDRHRAADPYIDTALRMAAANCEVVQNMLGRNIAEDAYTRAACARAAAAAVEFVGGVAGDGTPETTNLLQADGEKFGALVALFTETMRQGVKNDFTVALGHIAELVAMRRNHAAELQEALQQAADRQVNIAELARLLRGDAPAEVPREPTARFTTPDELAGTDEAPGQLPPSIGDQAIFDEAVAGMPLVKVERAQPEPEAPTTPARRRPKAKA